MPGIEQYLLNHLRIYYIFAKCDLKQIWVFFCFISYLNYYFHLFIVHPLLANFIYLNEYLFNFHFNRRLNSCLDRLDHLLVDMPIDSLSFYFIFLYNNVFGNKNFFLKKKNK